MNRPMDHSAAHPHPQQESHFVIMGAASSITAHALQMSSEETPYSQLRHGCDEVLPKEASGGSGSFYGIDEGSPIFTALKEMRRASEEKITDIPAVQNTPHPE